ncbi:hypothetical protein [Deinococcus frigens]|uniref:hypothetical protein n=1 Tax=Deinococcus frigens TaxID=249403 RepID=UPI0009FC18B5|nr:hypothetical protein [Deinococcus frigens]
MTGPSFAPHGDACARVDAHIRELLVDRQGFALSHKAALWAPRPPALDILSEHVHQGENGTRSVESVGDCALLALIFDASVPLGQVKVQARQMVALLATILDKLRAVPEVQPGGGLGAVATARPDDLPGEAPRPAEPFLPLP